MKTCALGSMLLKDRENTITHKIHRCSHVS